MDIKKLQENAIAAKDALTKKTEETKTTLEKSFVDAMKSWDDAIIAKETEAKTDTTKTTEASQARIDFDKFKSDLWEDINALLTAKETETNESFENTNSETNNLAADILKPWQYTIEELQTLKNKPWKELWTDPKYIKTIQQIIIDTGAKHNSIRDEILTNGIYGRGTKAGIKTLQNYLNTKYTAKLTPDGIAGPATLTALLEMDGDKTRLDKLIADHDHTGITPLEPESIKSVKAKKKATWSTWAAWISDPAKWSTEEDPKNGTIDNQPEIKLENNTQEWITSIDKLPKDFKRDKNKNTSYLFQKDWIRYRFFDTGRVAVFKDVKKPGKMANSKDIFYKLQNTTDNNIVENIDNYNITIGKEYWSHLNDLFQTMTADQKNYYKSNIKMNAKITCTSSNPDIILHINTAEIKLQKSDYLKADGKTINYTTIHQKVVAYIDEKIKENQKKEWEKNIKALKDKLEDLDGYTKDILFPNTQDEKTKDFFALFGTSWIKFDNIESVSNDKNKVQFVFDIKNDLNSNLINWKMRWKIDINDILKNNTIDEDLFIEQLKKNITNNLNNAKKPQSSPST